MASAAPAPAFDDRTFRGIADPARRRILDLLRVGPVRTGDLADDLTERYGVSRFMVMKHLKILVDAGLVVVVRRGRERWNHLNAVPIREIYRRWIEPFAAEAADSVLRLKRSAETRPAPESHFTREPGDPPMSEAKKADPAVFEVQEIVVEVQINAPREKVWSALTESTSSWWPKDYYVNSEGAKFRIDAKIGGHAWEDRGNGEGTIWATVTHVQRPESLRLSAEMWPEFGGPARTIQRYQLTEKDDGTLLRFTDTMYGRIRADSLESMDEGWRYLLGRAFKDFVEEGKRPPDQSPLSC